MNEPFIAGSCSNKERAAMAIAYPTLWVSLLLGWVRGEERRPGRMIGFGNGGMKTWMAFRGVCLATIGTAIADSDQDRARRAVEQGLILPFKDILGEVQQAYPGQILKAELDDEDGVLVEGEGPEPQAMRAAFLSYRWS